jgi:Zn-dependent M28 family amino/carboxypeptidase
MSQVWLLHELFRLLLTKQMTKISSLALLCCLLHADSLEDGKRWWKHVEILADDRMEGRNTGSEGHRKAAEYVAQEFERSGLKPAGKTYLQAVPFRVQRIEEPKCSVELIPSNGVPEPLKLGDDVILSTRGDFAKSIEVEAVFVGHGLVIPEVQYNDLTGLDLKGKAVVILSGGPSTIPGNLKSHYSSSEERWKALRAAGAVGVISIQNPKSMDVPWARQSAARLQPAMRLADAASNEGSGSKLGITINPDRVDRFLEGTGHNFKELLALADADKPLPKFPLLYRFRVRAAAKEWAVQSQNVAAVVEGSDAGLKHEYVVLSAHLDHLGTTEAAGADKIFNGAMDNASGIGWLLETARRVQESGLKPRRSLLFVAVTGEEKGLQGSKYFAAHPLVQGKLVADINMDMVLPLFPLKYLEVQGLAESSLGRDIREVCRAHGVEVQLDKEPNKNRFIRSDQYSFIKSGVPSLAFKFGWVKGSQEEQIFNSWYKERYHAVSDDLSQSVDLEGAGLFTSILFELLERVADNPIRPQWNADSFFKRFAK